MGDYDFNPVMFSYFMGIGCGSHYARFKSFFFKPSQMIDYAKSFFKKAPSDYIGHNPLGGLSVFAMIIVIVLQSLSGLAMTDDIFFEGPFYHYFDQGILSVIDIIHRQNFNIILVIIAFHISAVFYYLFYKKNNLIRPMISGYKEGNCNNGKASLYQGYSKASKGVCLLLSALLWWALYQNLSL